MKTWSLLPSLAFLIGILIASPSAGLAQEETAEAAPQTEEAQQEEVAEEADRAVEPLDKLAIDPESSLLEVQLAVRPLPLEEVEKVAAAWQEILTQHEEHISELELGYERLKRKDELQGNEAEMLFQELNQLREERSLKLNIFTNVLNNMDSKGGDTASMRLYASSISGLNINPTDVVSTWAAIKGWMTSREGGIAVLRICGRFVLIMLIAWTLAGFIGRAIHRVVEKQPRLSGLMKRFVERGARRAVLLVGLLIALSSLGINVSALLTLVGGGAFIIGLALQDSLSNFANGVMLLIYRPFDVGDAVEVNGISGSVDAVSLVSTRIRSWDNKLILVPNKDVWGQTITNMTGTPQRRVDMVFGIGYDDDADKAREILADLVSEHPDVLESPETVIRVHELGDSAVNLICRPWVKTSDYWKVYWDITDQAKKAFDKSGISIPYPQRDVHVYSASNEAGEAAK